MVDFVDINGARLAYRICGPENGPLIITLHGGRGMGNHRSDYKAYSSLGDGYRVLSFDFRGHGQSSPTKPYTFEQLVDDVEGVRRYFAGAETQAIIIGGSFGGFLAQRYAVKYASRVSHLVLRGTAPSYHHEEDAIRVLQQRIARAPSFSLEMLRDKVFGAFESDLEFRLVHLAMSPLYSESFDANAALKNCLDNAYNAEAHSKAPHKPSLSALLETLELTSEDDLYSEKEKYFDYRDQLYQVKAKTLVVVGDKDWICPPENSEFIVSKIPTAKLLIVKDANHSVHLERNELVVRSIRDHIES